MSFLFVLIGTYLPTLQNLQFSKFWNHNKSGNAHSYFEPILQILTE